MVVHDQHDPRDDLLRDGVGDRRREASEQVEGYVDLIPEDRLDGGSRDDHALMGRSYLGREDQTDAE